MIKDRNSRLLLTVGLLVIALAQLMQHFANLTDMLRGIIMGIGIGIEILAVVRLTRVRRARVQGMRN